MRLENSLLLLGSIYVFFLLLDVSFIVNTWYEIIYQTIGNKMYRSYVSKTEAGLLWEPNFGNGFQ